MIQEVKKCRDCPMYNDGAGEEYQTYCQHPASSKKWPDSVLDRLASYPPDWCPLKKESIEIKLVQ